MAHKIKLPRRMSGFGLAEILIAMVIGMFLMAGMTQVFIGSKKAYRVQEAMARVQESGRFAMEILGRDIRMGGYQGCGSLLKIAPNVIANNMPGRASFDSSDGIRGYEYNGAFSPLYGDTGGLADDPANVVASTDVITVSRADDCGAYLVDTMAAGSSTIKINGNNSCSLAANDLLVISDCASSDLFRASGVFTAAGETTISHAATHNASSALSKPYGQDARIYRFARRDYYIRNNAFGEPALYRRENGGAAQELVEGVSDLQILYGEDTGVDQYVDRYVDADDATAIDWEKVGSVRVNVGLTSVQNILSVDAAAASGEAGGQLQQNMTSTISIRNKLP